MSDVEMVDLCDDDDDYIGGASSAASSSKALESERALKTAALARLESAKREVQVLKEQLDTARLSAAEVPGLKRDLRSLEDDKRVREHALASSKAAEAGAKAAEADARGQVLQLEQEIEALRGKLSNHKKASQELKRAKDADAAELQSSQAEIVNLKEAAAMKQQEIEDVRRNLSTHKKELQRAKDAAHTELQRSQAEAAALRREIAVLKQAAAAKQQEFEDINNLLVHVQCQLAEDQAALKKMKAGEQDHAQVAKERDAALTENQELKVLVKDSIAAADAVKAELLVQAGIISKQADSTAQLGDMLVQVRDAPAAATSATATAANDNNVDNDDEEEDPERNALCDSDNGSARPDSIAAKSRSFKAFVGRISGVSSDDDTVDEVRRDQAEVNDNELDDEMDEAQVGSGVDESGVDSDNDNDLDNGMEEDSEELQQKGDEENDECDEQQNDDEEQEQDDDSIEEASPDLLSGLLLQQSSGNDSEVEEVAAAPFATFVFAAPAPAPVQQQQQQQQSAPTPPRKRSWFDSVVSTFSTKRSKKQ